MSKINDKSYNSNIVDTYTSCLPASMMPVRFEVPSVATVVDTETTGLYPLSKGRYVDRDKGGDEMVSIGLVRIEQNRIVDRKEWCINPGRPIPYETTRVHGITDEMVRDMPRFEEIARDVFQFMGDAPLVIHNSDFDISFLFYALSRCKIQLPQYRIIDTLELARLSLPLGKSASLDSVMTQLGISHIDRTQHGALKDALATALVFMAFCNSAMQFDVQSSPTPINAQKRPIRTSLLDPSVRGLAERFAETLEKKKIEQHQVDNEPSP